MVLTCTLSFVLNSLDFSIGDAGILFLGRSGRSISCYKVFISSEGFEWGPLLVVYLLSRFFGFIFAQTSCFSVKTNLTFSLFVFSSCTFTVS
jgi:hypothetical protein